MVKVINGEIELGQGMFTVYAQIAAEEMGVKVEDVEIVPYVDTDVSPFGFGTSGSKVTNLGGNAVLLAAKDVKRQLLKYAAGKNDLKPSNLEVRGGNFYLKGCDKAVDTVKDVATFIDPHRYASGIPYVIVNGVVVIDGGEHTGALPGKPLTRPLP